VPELDPSEPRVLKMGPVSLQLIHPLQIVESQFQDLVNMIKVKIRHLQGIDQISLLIAHVTLLRFSRPRTEVEFV
jgi:hypothetical protein